MTPMTQVRRLARPAALAVVLTVALAGCASTPATNYEVDSRMVSAIESAARASGTHVIWINYPVKRTDAAAEPKKP